MTHNVILINPELRMVRNANAPSDINKFARDYIKCDSIDHGTVQVLASGSRLCIIVYEYGLVGGEQASKSFFSLNRQLYNGKAVLYMADYRGETISVIKTLAPHWDSGDCPDLTWADDAETAEKLITDNLCQRPQTLFNGKVVWEWSPTTNYDKWRATMEKETKANLKF